MMLRSHSSPVLPCPVRPADVGVVGVGVGIGSRCVRFTVEADRPNNTHVNVFG